MASTKSTPSFLYICAISHMSIRGADGILSRTYVPDMPAIGFLETEHELVLVIFAELRDLTTDVLEARQHAPELETVIGGLCIGHERRDDCRHDELGGVRSTPRSPGASQCSR